MPIDVFQCEVCAEPFQTDAKGGREPRYCSAHCTSLAQRACIQPTKPQLALLIDYMPAYVIGTLYGVSGSAVKKWCKKHRLIPKTRGYWAKRWASEGIPPSVPKQASHPGPAPRPKLQKPRPGQRLNKDINEKFSKVQHLID